MYTNKKRDNLNAINDWCKSVALDEIIYVDNALFCNNRYYRLSVSKYGIGAWGMGKFSSWLHCNEESDSLYTSKVGTEIIYNWQNIKPRILHKIEECKQRQDIMENFIV